MARFPEARALVGRIRDIERSIALVNRGERLITILGPPGIGKTTLAIHVAHQLSAHIPGVFCDLSDQRTAHDLAIHLLASLDEPGRQPDDVALLLAAAGPLLLFLDNFEQLVDSAATVATWVKRAPELTVIVTSRERLAVDPECVVELQPLGLPDAVTSAEASEAVQLFMKRAADAGARDAELSSVVAIVKALDGIPLAIELAAARTRVLAPRDLAERLALGRNMLALGKREPMRHRTLADAIAWSWDLLDPAERSALACCSAFATTFTVGAAEEVLAACDIDSPVDLLMGLRDKSMIHAAGAGRLGIYASIRQFAEQRLTDEMADLRGKVKFAHAKLFATQAQGFVRTRLLLGTPGVTHGDARRDVDNLRSALAHVRTLPESHARSEMFAQLTSALTWMAAFPIGTAPIDEALTAEPRLSPALEAMMRLTQHQALAMRGQFDEAIDRARAVIADPVLPDDMRAAALVRIGIHHRENGEAERALAAHEEAADMLAQTFSSLRGINTACMGRLMCDLRRHDEARQLNEEAASLCDGLGERWLAALARANLAQLEQELGELAHAEALLERAIVRFREAGEPHYEGFYAAICAGLYFEWERHDLARHWYDAAVSPTDSLSRAFSKVLLHGGWAALEAVDGDPPTALHHMELARESLVRCPGALARLLAEIHGMTVELATGTGSQSRARGHRERFDELASGHGDDATVVNNNLDTRFALRILARVLRSHLRAAPVLLVHGAADWFQIESNDARVDLRRRAAPRRLLAALVEAHRKNALSTASLFEAGWPGQQIQAESAATRVRVAIATLRKMGLRDVLLTRDDGYLLDPAMSIQLKSDA